jgi:hypothetical protein
MIIKAHWSISLSDATVTDSTLQVTKEAVLRALFAAEPRLASQGCTGRGYLCRCPRGHIYVIGDCGGAAVTARCPECGATIGGTNHNLAAGNATLALADLQL